MLLSNTSILGTSNVDQKSLLLILSFGTLMLLYGFSVLIQANVPNLRNTAISYVSTVLTAVATFILERKRIQGVNIFKKILLCLIWPLFLALQFPMDVQAFFSKNLDWKPIPHEDHKTLTHI